jgi:hypothetical protein
LPQREPSLIHPIGSAEAHDAPESNHDKNVGDKRERTVPVSEYAGHVAPFHGGLTPLAPGGSPVGLQLPRNRFDFLENKPDDNPDEDGRQAGKYESVVPVQMQRQLYGQRRSHNLRDQSHCKLDDAEIKSESFGISLNCENGTHQRIDGAVCKSG